MCTMFKARRGLSDGSEERYGLMSSGIKGMSSTRRKIRHWQKLFRLKLGRHMFLGLMILIFMCVLTKFVLLNMFSDQLTLDPIIHANMGKNIRSPNKSPVCNNLFHMIFYVLNQNFPWILWFTLFFQSLFVYHIFLAFNIFSPWNRCSGLVLVSCIMLSI